MHKRYEVKPFLLYYSIWDRTIQDWAEGIQYYAYEIDAQKACDLLNREEDLKTLPTWQD